MIKRNNDFKLVLIVLIVLTSCGNHKDKTKSEGTIIHKVTTDSEYLEDTYYSQLNSFDTMFISHFPKNLKPFDIKNFVYSPEIYYSNYPSIYLVVEKSDTEIQDIRKKYFNDGLLILNAADSNLLVINIWESLNKSGFSVKRDERLQAKLDRIGKSDLPVPNFYKLELDGGEKTQSQLSHDFEIIVIDSRKGLFEEFDKLSGRDYVPEIWEHGFSKGIAMSESQNLVIYWAIIW